MFDQYKVAQEVFNMSKTYWEHTMEMMTAFQDQNEQMWTTLMEQGFVAQEQSKKMLNELLIHAKQARAQFSRTMDDNWKQAESVFGTNQKTGK